MTNKKAIEVLKVRLLGEPDELIEAKKKAIESLEQTEWILVTEKLLEDGERVLITYDGEGVRCGFVKLVTYDEMRGRFYDSHAIALDQDCITAWMPLPKPYEAESEDK